MAFARAWQEAYPDDENFGYELDDYQRQIRVDVRERLGVQHKTYADETGHSDVAEHKPGECNIAFIGAKASFPVPATSNAGCLAVATDESNQLYYWSGSAWAKVQEPVLITGDQEIAGDKTFTDDVTVNGVLAGTLADGTSLESDAAPTADEDVANKKYVDDQLVNSCADGISRSINTAYQATTSGTLIVNATITWIYNTDTYVELLSDINATPTFVKAKIGGKCTRGDSANNIMYLSANVRIKKGDYYMVVPTASGVTVNSIYFYPDT